MSEEQREYEDNQIEDMEANIEEQVESMEQEQPEEEQHSPGYQSYEEYVAAGGDPNNFKGPKAYDDFGKLLKTVEDLRRELRLKDHTTNTVLKEFQNIQLREREKIYEELYNQRNAAIDVGDHQQVDQLTNQMYQVASEYQKAKQQAVVSAIDPYEKQFIQNNPQWFSPDMPYEQIVQSPKYREAQQHVMQIAYEIRAQGKDPNQHLDDILNQVENRMKGNQQQNIGEQGQQNNVNFTPQQPKVNMSASQSNVNKSAQFNNKFNFSANQKKELEELNKINAQIGLPAYTDDQAREYFKKHKVK